MKSHIYKYKRAIYNKYSILVIINILKIKFFVKCQIITVISLVYCEDDCDWLQYNQSRR